MNFGLLITLLRKSKLILISLQCRHSLRWTGN